MHPAPFHTSTILPLPSDRRSSVLLALCAMNTACFLPLVYPNCAVPRQAHGSAYPVPLSALHPWQFASLSLPVLRLVHLFPFLFWLSSLPVPLFALPVLLPSGFLSQSFSVYLPLEAAVPLPSARFW